MSLSPNSSLVQQTIDMKFAQQQRASAIKWMCINAALFLIFTWDLWQTRARAGALHWAQAGAGAVCAAAALRHAARLAARAAPAAPRALSPRQRRLLGLRDDSRESSFCVPEEAAPSAAEAEAPGSLSPARSWRARAAAPPAAPPEPAAPAPRDLFIADAGELRRYLRSVEEAVSGAEAAPPPGAYVSPAAPAYQLSAARAPAARGPGPAPPLASPAHLDPARLAHYNLNLRRWLHATVVERLASELAACGAELARAGLAARPGAAAPARLAALAAAAPGPLAARLRALLPFLRPFADQAYVTARVRDLARGGCLAAYRWDGGGAGWDETRPADAELVLHLFAAYLDSLAPGGAGGGVGGADGAGAFSAAHLSAAPGAPRPLGVHRARRAPPHYLVSLGARLLDPGAGRDNLLHALLLLLAAAAARRPPTLLRLHLGPAGLNMLWILDR